ncbi:MAG: hypothetical protein V4501_02925 [Pseudomonadota bacterium]
MQQQEIKEILNGTLTLKTREDYEANQGVFESNYDIYEFNQRHQHITQRFQAIAELSKSDSLTLTPPQKDSLHNFIKTGNTLLSTFTELKNYGSEHWFYAGGGLLNNGYWGGPDISPRIVIKINELLKNLDKVLKPTNEAQFKGALTDLKFQADYMASGLKPGLGKIICEVVTLFVGAALAAMGTYLIVNASAVLVPAAAAATTAGAITVIGGLSVAAGAIILYNSLSFFAKRSYSKKITDFKVELNNPTTAEAIKEIQSYSSPSPGVN